MVGRQVREEAGRADQTRKQGKSRWVAGIMGGVATFILGIIPVIGPIAGGAVGGYFRGNDEKEGAIVGALSGVLASIPGILLAILFMVFGVVGAMADGSGGEAALGAVVWIGIFVVAFIYMIVFCGVGGVIGAAFSDRQIPR